MHEHNPVPKWLLDFFESVGFLSVLLLVGLVLFLMGGLPIPVGYERGKIKWLMWCGTGMHAHIVYWQTAEQGYTDTPGFQTLHPQDYSGGDCDG